MHPRQNTIAAQPKQQPTQSKGLLSPLPHANRLNGRNDSFKTAELPEHKNLSLRP